MNECQSALRTTNAALVLRSVDPRFLTMAPYPRAEHQRSRVGLQHLRPGESTARPFRCGSVLRKAWRRWRTCDCRGCRCPPCGACPALRFLRRGYLRNMCAIATVSLRFYNPKHCSNHMNLKQTGKTKNSCPIKKQHADPERATVIAKLCTQPRRGSTAAARRHAAQSHSSQSASALHRSDTAVRQP